MILDFVFSATSILKALPREFWGTVLLFAFFGVILYISDRKAMVKDAYHTKDE